MNGTCFLKSAGLGKPLLWIVGISTIALVGLSQPAGATSCGPGAHWVDTCVGGIDEFHSRATVNLDLPFDGNLDGQTDLTLHLSSPSQRKTIIIRSNPIDTPDSLDPGHFNQIQTEMVFLELTGVSQQLGPVILRAGDGVANFSQDGPLFSSGAIIEGNPDPFHADSFFDVFVELELPNLGLTLHNISPIRVEAEIGQVPPFGTHYIHQGPTPLFDPAGNPIAQIVDAIHTPVPEPSTWIIFASGLAGLAVWRRRK